LTRTKKRRMVLQFLTSACMLTTGEAALGNVKWYLDSGATDHMVLK